MLLNYCLFHLLVLPTYPNELKENVNNFTKNWRKKPFSKVENLAHTFDSQKLTRLDIVAEYHMPHIPVWF